MKQIISYTCLFLLIVLTSFSGKRAQKINIVFIGDSITEGSALSKPETEAPPVYVAQLLKLNKQLINVNISNRGYSGHTTVDFLPKSNIDFPKVLSAANAFATDKEATLLFSIMLGTNDSAMFGPNGSPVSPKQYKHNLDTIIGTLIKQYPQAKFVLQYPLWYSPNTHNNAGYMQEGLSRLQSYFKPIDELYAQYKHSNPNTVYLGEKSVFDFFRKRSLALLKAEQGKNGIFYLHPNAAGSKALAQFWTKAILKVIK